jgi:predicted glycogen debranching enzyme
MGIADRRFYLHLAGAILGKMSAERAMLPYYDPWAEWLEADGLGGFASGTVSGRRSRRYHAVLLAAATPPTGRVVLVNGFEALVEVAGATFAISSQHYAPDVIHPDGERRIESFEPEPWPRWVFCLESGHRVEQELFVPHGRPAVAIRWRLVASPSPMWLTVRPLLSGRDYHALHHENDALRFDAELAGERVRWQPYDGIPNIAALSNGTYDHGPMWYRNFLYQMEAERGLDCVEDLASPGEFRWDLAAGDAVLILSTEGLDDSLPVHGVGVTELYARLRTAELQRRESFPSSCQRAADAYIVRRGTGRTIVAGYSWFTDWGRDTFISLRGLAIATGRLDVARDVLLAWSSVVSAGMLPNRFPDHGDAPEYNSVDASLWYVVAVHDFLMAIESRGEPLAEEDRDALTTAVQAILEGYIRGTRFRIHVDDDGLVAAGEPGMQLTWMDAKVDGWVVTPRIGKPVEIQALWLNALWIAERLLPDAGPWSALIERGREAFSARFWSAEHGYLADVVDVDHEPGRVDASLRPNQIFAVGGLPLQLLDGARAAHVVDVVEEKLWTPLGLRTLSPDDPAYQPRYHGDLRQRDAAYHQGTAWPWLAGPFVDAWLRVHGNTAESRRVARGRFVEPLVQHLSTAGLGHVSEIADGDPPHTPRGCPFQAWSLGELVRLVKVVLADPPTPPQPALPSELAARIT